MRGGKEIIRWAALWHSKNKLEGVCEHIIFEECMPKLFIRKKDAMEFIKVRFGYIAKRKDLRAEPHGWRMPKPVKVKVKISQMKINRSKK